MSFFNKMFGSEKQILNEQIPTQQLNIQDLFAHNLGDIPNETFDFTLDVNWDDRLIVRGIKNLSYKEAGIFECIKVYVFQSGEVNIIFEAPKYSANQFPLLSTFLSKLYKILGPDSKGNTCLTAQDQSYLTTPGDICNISAWIDWASNGSYTFRACLDEEITFTASQKSTERIKEKFYVPNAVRTRNGLIPEREKILSHTEVSMEYDEFEKKRSFKLTKLASSAQDTYLYTYSFDESVFKDLSALTKLGISFTYSEGTFFIHLLSFDKNLPLDKGDKIIFLFEDDSTVEVEMIIPKSKFGDNSFRTVTVLSNDQVRTFATKRLKKWKLTSFKNSVYQVGGFAKNIFIKQYKCEPEGQYILQSMLKSLIVNILMYEKNSMGFTLEE